jgi:hypothetical protein
MPVYQRKVTFLRFQRRNVTLRCVGTRKLGLPACRHFYSGPIPDRSPSPGTGPSPQIPPVSVSGRLPASSVSQTTFEFTNLFKGFRG